MLTILINEARLVEAGNYEDPTLQESVAAFKKFEKTMYALDQSIVTFMVTAQQLESSVGPLASAIKLSGRLAKITALFHGNAAEIFPQIRSKSVDNLRSSTIPKRYDKKAAAPSEKASLKPAITTPDPEILPDELFRLAIEFDDFLKHLKEFPGFMNDALTTSITTLVNDLKYRSDYLSDYQGQFRWPAVQRYIHALSIELITHMQAVTRSLEDFVNNGVPVMRSLQKHDWSYLVNLSTTAAFFSGVTATAAQYSFARTGNTLENMVNLLFFGSLVLSISTVVNSLLGLTWKQAIYRSPRHRVPWWILVWITRSPIVSMVISVSLFSTGLVCFCFTTQTLFVSVTILLLTCFATFGLLVVSTWFMAEWWIYRKHRGLRWLSDVIHDHWDSFINYPPIRHIRYIPRWVIAVCRKFGTFLSCMGRNDGDSEIQLPFAISIGGRDVGSFPVHQKHGRPEKVSEKGKFTEALSATTEMGHPLEAKTSQAVIAPLSTVRVLSLATTSIATSIVNSPNTSDQQHVTPGTSMDENTKLKGVKRFRAIGWKVVASQKAQQQPTKENSLVSAVRAVTGRLTTIRPRLKKMEVTHTILDHTALVKHIQFSPSGKLLATCGWDGTAKLFNIPGDASGVVRKYRVMDVYDGFLGQVAWSPDGRWLVTKWPTGMAIWSEDGERRWNISRGRHVHSVAWFPTGQAILSVEGSQIVELRLDGTTIYSHEFERLDIHEVAITPDEERIVGIGVLRNTRYGLVSVMARVERQLVVYNLRKRRIETSVPVLDDVRSVTISRKGSFALISPESYGYTQLFRLDEFKVSGVPTVRLVPFRTYVPRTEVEFAGGACFAGQQDELVFVPTKSGDIIFWDRDTGHLLHTLRDWNGDLTSVACSYTSQGYILASASHDGSVRVWMSRPEPIASIDEKREQEVEDANILKAK